MKTTLSTAQWQKLQSLFDQAEGLEPNAACILIESIRSQDALIAESLDAMLGAHHQWHSRTGAALDGLIEATTPTAVGMQLGAYQLTQEIGRGGMGVVYLGERSDGQVQQQVAIKVLHTRNLDPNTRARFQREREILAAFDHPGIARLLDAGESAAGEPYYVMEYLRGLPIDAHCDQQKLGIRARLQLFQKVCAAVQYAHAQLILHRDIKPSNIIVDAAGAPKLIDFGIAKPITLLDAVSAEATSTHQRYFSPINAAPEQIRGETVAVTCDVYQLGTLLHELLCGRPIFDLSGTSAAELEQKICAIIPDAPSISAISANEAVVQSRNLHTHQALARTLRGDLDAIVQRALRKEPHLRYASVEQLAQDIERHLQDQPVLGRRGDRAYRLSRFVKRNWRGLGIAVASVIAVGVFTALLFLLVQQTSVERDRAVEASKRAESVTEFLLDIFRSGDPAVAKRAAVPIGEALGRAKMLLESRLATEPVVRAQVAKTLAEIYLALGEFESAETMSRQALGDIDLIPNVPPELLIAQLRQSASVLFDRAKYSQAEALLARLNIIEPGSAGGNAGSWQSQMLRVRIASRTDEAAACRYAEAIPGMLSVDAADYAEAYARAQITLATTCLGNNNIDKAVIVQRLDDVRRAESIVDAQMGADDVLLIELRRIQAGLLRRQKKNDEANALLERMLAQIERVYGANSHSYAKGLMGMGMKHYSEGHNDQAVVALQRAFAIFESIHHQAPSGDMAAAAFNLGVTYDYGRIDQAKALQWYSKAVEVGIIAFGPESSNVGEFSSAYGTLVYKSGDLKKAEQALAPAIRILPIAAPSGIRARLSLAGVMAAQKRWKEVASLMAEIENGDPVILAYKSFAAELTVLRAQLATVK